MEENFDVAIKMLNGQGHTVRPYIRQGRLWFEINGNMLATRQEMLELADGVYSLEELLELSALRRTEQQGS
jgi:hypothetical protein